MFFVCASVSRTRLVVSWTWYKTCGCSSARHWHMSWVRLLTVSNSWLISLLLLMMMMMWRCINFCYRNILTDETLKLWLHSTIQILLLVLSHWDQVCFLDPEIDGVELHDRSRSVADRLDFWPPSRLNSTLVNSDRLDRLFSLQFSRTSCCMNFVCCMWTWGAISWSWSCSHV